MVAADICSPCLFWRFSDFERRLFCLGLRLRDEVDAAAFAAHWTYADVNFGLILREALCPGL
jgi:hypothetical protein